jgi:hypothetical protein
VCISLQSGSLGDWDGGGYGIHRYPGGGSPGSNSACALLFPTLLGGSLSTVQAATMAEALAPSPVSAAPRMIAVEARGRDIMCPRSDLPVNMVHCLDHFQQWQRAS